MNLFFEIIKFVIYSLIIVFVSKNVLVKLLRKLAVILDLRPKTVGDIAGVATSMPELLTVFFSSIQGLASTSIFNILSSNVINLIQYICSIKVNKNAKVLKNIALRIELIIVGLTILIPILMVFTGIGEDVTIVPIFLLMFLFFYYIKTNAYKYYKMHSISNKEEDIIQEEKRWIRDKKKKATITGFELLGVGIILFVIGNLLGNTFESLSKSFNIPEPIIGIVLGFVTSIPELITFIEAQKHHSKNKEDIQGVIEATSNLFTSNMLNLFVIQSIGIVVIDFLAKT